MHKRTNFLTSAIVKAMSMFGGVQVVNIVCSLVRNKVVALLVGPSGLGLVSVLNSAMEFLTTATTLGLRNSATRYLAGETKTEDRERMVWTVRRWAWITGIFGVIVTIVLSPYLSLFTFNSYDKWWAFAVLSIGVLVNSLTMGEMAVLQGTYKLSALAKGTALGNILGLFVVFPLIYYMRESGIIPMIVAYYILTGAALWRVSHLKSVYCAGISVSRTELIEKGKKLLSLGIMLTLSTSVAYLFNYAFIICLKFWGGDSTVGLYQSGYMLVNRYADLVFAAMAVEYFPRLTSVAFSNHRTGVFVRQQIIVTMSILLPLVVLFIPLRDIAVKLLYSSEFIEISPYIAIAATGTVLKATSWCMSFVMISKADGKIYLATETISAIIGFSLSVAGYKLMGIPGIGAGYVLWCAIYTIIVGLVYYRRYHLRLGKSTYFVIGIAQVTVCVSMITALQNQELMGWVVAAVGVIIGLGILWRNANLKTRVK